MFYFAQKKQKQLNFLMTYKLDHKLQASIIEPTMRIENMWTTEECM